MQLHVVIIFQQYKTARYCIYFATCLTCVARFQRHTLQVVITIPQHAELVSKSFDVQHAQYVVTELLFFEVICKSNNIKKEESYHANNKGSKKLKNQGLLNALKDEKMDKNLAINIYLDLSTGACIYIFIGSKGYNLNTLSNIRINYYLN